jgi:hypothetical protein
MPDSLYAACVVVADLNYAAVGFGRDVQPTRAIKTNTESALVEIGVKRDRID